MKTTYFCLLQYTIPLRKRWRCKNVNVNLFQFFLSNSRKNIKMKSGISSYSFLQKKKKNLQLELSVDGIERIKGIDYRQTYDGASRNNVGDRCCPVRSSVSDIAETSCSMTSDTSVCFSHGNGRKIIGSFRRFCHESAF